MPRHTYDTETPEQVRVRLAWVIAATGYDPEAPGAFYPHIFHADGSVDYRDGSLRWRAGEPCATLNGSFEDEELIDIGTHMLDIQRALWAAKHGDADPPPPAAGRSPGTSSAAITPRIRFAFRLLHFATCAVPAGPSRDMLRHLVRHWQRRWCMAEGA